MKIHVMSTDLWNKIAAGEVVERPASVVKELVENAIDAGSTRIEVTAVQGGRKLVRVADNGSGMGREDAALAPECHATSKLDTFDDLQNLETMGFRGEALASIASVSNFTLRTRREEDVIGTQVKIDGGSAAELSDCGTPVGTIVEVRDLFANVPARRNFLKSYQTEYQHVRQQLVVHAIAWPKIGFFFTHDNERIYQLRPADDLSQRLNDLFGAEFMAKFLPIDATLGEVRVWGWAGLPEVSRGDSQGQYVFVNRRPASAPVVGGAIREAYSTLDKKHYPCIFLFIDLPPSKVDVNVHPTKREVRFRNSSAVRDAVVYAVNKAFGIHTPMPSTPTWTPGGKIGEIFPPPTPPEPVPQPLPTPERYHPIDENTFRIVDPFGASKNAGATTTTAPAPAPVPAPQPPEPRPTPISPFDGYATTTETEEPWNSFTYLAKLKSGYVLIETDSGFAVVDPRAMHERVIYERLLRNANVAEHAQPFLTPEPVQLTPADYAIVFENLELLRQMGFDIDEYGRDTVLVRAMPEVVSGAQPRAVLEEIVAAFREKGAARGAAQIREKTLAAAAGRGAVRSSRELTREQILPLLLELAHCRDPYRTPDGRKPTMRQITTRDLDATFGRG